MKTLIRLMLIALCVCGGYIGSALAGDVTIPNTFVPNTPANAEEVNANFSEVAKEVNDNDTRIGANASNISTNATNIQSKQNQVTGECDAGESIRVINEDGSVECEVDDSSQGSVAGLLDYNQPASGYIDVNGLGVGSGSFTTLRSISFDVPADGYVMVTITGRGCIHTANKYVVLWLKKGTDNLNFAHLYSVRGATTNQACAVGQSTNYAFQHVEAVGSGESFSFQVVGYKGDSATTSGNVAIHSMAAVFLQGIP